VQQSAAPALQRQTAQVPTSTTATSHTQTESAAASGENPVTIWTNEVIIPVTRAHTVLAGSGPVSERASQALEDVGAVRDSIQSRLMPLYPATSAVGQKLTHLHGLMQTVMVGLQAHAGEAHSIEDIRNWLNPSAPSWSQTLSAITSSGT
jgi:hypothetical protein